MCTEIKEKAVPLGSHRGTCNRKLAAPHLPELYWASTNRPCPLLCSNVQKDVGPFPCLLNFVELIKIRMKCLPCDHTARPHNHVRSIRRRRSLLQPLCLGRLPRHLHISCHVGVLFEGRDLQKSHMRPTRAGLILSILCMLSQL